MKDCLILADDLSGAADSAVSALHAGLDAEVFLTAEGAQESRTDVVAIGGEGCATILCDAERLLDCKQDLAVAIKADATFPDDVKPSHVLAGLLAPLLKRVGALLVTGGETCRALLEWIGARKLQLLDELEPGVSLAFVSAPRPLLVVVKAGGFGDPDTLQNAYRFLKKIRISHE